MMQFIEQFNWHQIPENSLLHHSKDVSDYRKCYAIQLDRGLGRIEDVVEKIQSLWPVRINSIISKDTGFIHLKPFFATKEEVIYGLNTKHTEWRISFLRHSENPKILYLILLFNYNSVYGRLIFRPVGILFNFYLKAGMKKILSHYELVPESE